MRHDEHAYDHIMLMPRHECHDRPHMTNYDRAAQFAPFAALTGYDSIVEETARLTDGRPILDEDEKHIIDVQLRELRQGAVRRARISYFVPDERKRGGAILRHEGEVAAVNETLRLILFADGAGIRIDDIVEAELLPDGEEDPR